MKKQTLKLGTHRKNRRVWLENAALLIKAGFEPGAAYNAFYRPVSKSIDLILQPDGARIVSKKTTAGVEIPVIDLNNTKVGYALGEVEQIEIEYVYGLITIRGKS